MKTKCNHTPEPKTYHQWYAWIHEKIKTHKQIKCPNCGKYSIWVEREENTDGN